MTTKPPLQMILQGILHTEGKSKQKHERMGSIKLQESERSIDSASHTQILKQQKQLNGRKYRIPMDSTPPSKDTIWQIGLKRKTGQSVVYKRSTY
jgi:hypothetical protein